MGSKIRTVVWVMFENRSFDNMLGHLQFDNLVPGVRGIEKPLITPVYENPYQGKAFYPFEMRDERLSGDLPHERAYVATQLAAQGGTFRMNGFVQAAHDLRQMPNQPTCEPMGILTENFVRTSSFLAREFVVCDNWFSPVPSSTQPNRSMAFNGKTFVDDTKLRHIPTDDEFITTWMEQRGLRWRVYHAGAAPFFLLFGRGNPLGDGFRSFDQMADDFRHEADKNFPQLIIVDPAFSDDPFLFTSNDNHPPTTVRLGEDFLGSVYGAISGSGRWEDTLLVVTYDEHGGFYDHVPPPPIPYANPAVSWSRFESMGPRVPAIVASPLLGKAGACHSLFDHTSVLQLIADLFAGGISYSASVKARLDAGIQSLTSVLSLRGTGKPTLHRPKLAVPGKLLPASTTRLTEHSLSALDTPTRRGFLTKAQELMQGSPDAVKKKYPIVYSALSHVSRSNALVSSSMPTKKPIHPASHFKFGWTPDIPDQRDHVYGAPLAKLTKKLSLPSKVDLRSKCPPPYDQGNIGSCTANAIAAAFQFDRMKQRVKAFVPSRLFIYYNEREMENSTSVDKGAMIRDGIKSLSKVGVCPESSWTYDDTEADPVTGAWPAGAKPARRPPPKCYKEAQKYQALSYQRLTRNLLQFKGCLADGYPFVFGFSVYESFLTEQVMKTGVVNMPASGEAGANPDGSPAGHAVLCVGYDDKEERFIVRNSYGEEWGQGGYFTMPYSYLLTENLSDDFWTIRLVE